MKMNIVRGRGTPKQLLVLKISKFTMKFSTLNPALDMLIQWV